MERAPSVNKVIMKGLDALGLPLISNGAADLKKRADLARAQRDWAQDAYFRRQICHLDPERRGAWTQLGHALKEDNLHVSSPYFTA